MNRNRILASLGILFIIVVVLLACGTAFFVGQAVVNFVNNTNSALAGIEAHPPTTSQTYQDTQPSLGQTLCLGTGTYAGGAQDYAEYHQGLGYVIPRSVLLERAGDGALVFEGEIRTDGEHDVAVLVYPDGSFNSVVTEEGLILPERGEGSMWRELAVFVTGTCPAGYHTESEELTKLTVDKFNNWYSQGITQTPTITAWYPTGRVTFTSLDEVNVTPAEDRYIQSSINNRCNSSSPLEQNPMGEPQGNGMVSAAPGSSDCRTLIVQLGQSAYWFSGARDNVVYDPNNTRIFLVPNNWSITRLQEWVQANFALSLHQQ